jgi:hypothetical protein
MMRTDFRDRAVPWVKLLLEQRREQHEGAPSLGPKAMIGTAVVGSSAAFVVLGLAGIGRPAYLIAIALFLLSVFLYRDLYSWLYRRCGFRLALTAVPLHYAYLLISALAVPVGAALYFLSGDRTTPLRQGA